MIKTSENIITEYARCITATLERIKQKAATIDDTTARRAIVDDLSRMVVAAGKVEEFADAINRIGETKLN